MIIRTRKKTYRWTPPEWLKYIGGLAIIAAITFTVMGLCFNEIYQALFW